MNGSSFEPNSDHFGHVCQGHVVGKMRLVHDIRQDAEPWSQEAMESVCATASGSPICPPRVLICGL